jgi:hypothetical protein
MNNILQSAKPLPRGANSEPPPEFNPDVPGPM